MNHVLLLAFNRHTSSRDSEGKEVKMIRQQAALSLLVIGLIEWAHSL
jgi:hypothetical protein